MQGVVEKYMKDQGFGFILLKHPIGTGTSNLTKVFFHVRSVENEEPLQPGWQVRFRLDQNNNDPTKIIATGIKVLSREPIIEVPRNILDLLVQIARDTERFEDAEEEKAVVTAEKLLGIEPPKEPGPESPGIPNPDK